ncbi:hypothetical protein GCM10027341_15180 [Spirosoma knui]
MELSDGSGNFNNATQLVTPVLDFIYLLEYTNLPANLPYGTNYKFRLRVTNRSCVSNEVGPITIVPGVSQVTLASSGPLTCATTSVQLQARGGVEGASYRFTGPGLSGQPSSTSAVSVTASGVYSVTVTNLGVCSSIATTEVKSQTAAPQNIIPNSNSPLTCKQTSVRLTVPSAGNNATYAFSGPFPVSQPTGTSSHTATVSNPGEYTVLVTNAQGCTATATTLVEVNTDPPRNLSLSMSNVLTCAQPTAVLNASANGSPEFIITGPSGQSYSANTATISQPGEYTLTATGANGCTAVQTTTVESNTTPPQNVSLTNNGPLTCAQTSVQLSAFSSTTGVSYGLAGPEGYSASGPTVSANRPGTYTLTATGANGCSAVQTTTVESNTLAPAATLSVSGTLTCANQTVRLNYTFGPGTFEVRRGDLLLTSGSAATPGGDSEDIFIGDRTGGQIILTAINPINGCSATATSTIESNTTAPQNITLTNSGPLSFTNASVTLTATPGASYSYSFSTGVIQQGSGNTATINTTGVYSVTVTRQDNGCSSIASTTVFGGNNPTVCRGGTAVISVAVSGAPVKYEWYKNSLTSPKLMETPQLFRGTATSSLALINTQSNTQGNFYLKTTDQAGAVTIYGPFRLTVDAGCRAREVAQLETPLQVQLAPNPIQQDRLRAVVSGAEGRSLQVELVDPGGKPIRQQRWQQANTQQVIDWDLQSQSSGLYLLQVVSEAGNGVPAQRQSVKVIKP